MARLENVESLPSDDSRGSPSRSALVSTPTPALLERSYLATAHAKCRDRPRVVALEQADGARHQRIVPEVARVVRTASAISCTPATMAASGTLP